MHLALSIVGTLGSAAPGGGGGGGSPMQFLIPLVAIFFIFYFLVIKPQKRRDQDRQTLLGELKKGDTVFTTAGIIGKIRSLDEREVTLEVDKKGGSLRVLRQTIGGRYDKKSAEAPKLDAQGGGVVDAASVSVPEPATTPEAAQA